jgi:hypothetical protein
MRKMRLENRARRWIAISERGLSSGKIDNMA